MNNTCPSCGVSYPIKPEHIGRKMTCKSCAAALVITANGLDFKDEPTPPRAPKFAVVEEPPPPPELPAAEAFEGVDDGPSRPHRRRYIRRDGGLADFLMFHKMVAPIVVQVVFWIATLIIFFGGLVLVGFGLTERNINWRALGLLILQIPLAMILIRVYCEIIIVFFRMNDTLSNIYHELRRQRR